MIIVMIILSLLVYRTNGRYKAQGINDAVITVQMMDLDLGIQHQQWQANNEQGSWRLGLGTVQYEKYSGKIQ